jgi:3',5'-cyclic AMP phosphodiesterase CpdA
VTLILSGSATVVKSVQATLPQPDAVLVSGDLADHATDAEYECVRELLASLRAPVYVVAGNHDDRRALNRHFGVPVRPCVSCQSELHVGEFSPPSML